MRKLFSISLVICMVLIFASCASSTGTDKKSSTESAGNVTNSASSANQNTGTGSKSTADSKANGVIAKSGNAVTDKQKKALLDNLDKELGNLLNDIDSLEDVTDSDLSTSDLN